MKITDTLYIERESKIKLLFFCFLMLMMGRGSNWVLEIDPRTNPIGVLLLGSLLVGVISRGPVYRVRSRFVMRFIGALFVWYVYHLFTDIASPLYQGIQILIKAFLGFVVVRFYGLTFCKYYEKIIVFLTLIGLAFWMVEMAVGAGTLASLAPLDCYMHPGTKSFFVYSLISYLDSSSSFLGILRNCGFCWEPGLYASMLIIGITFNIARYKGKRFFRSKNFWILIIGLLTTLSTTGFLCLFVLLLLNSLAGETNLLKKIFAISLIIVLGILGASLPFMKDKIERQSDIENYMINNEAIYADNSARLTVERFEGMYLSWINAINNPMMGYGPNMDNSYTSKYFPMFRISNGNVNTLAILGFPLGLFFYLLLYKGTKKMIAPTGYKIGSIVFIMFLLFTASYNFSFEILTFAMCFSLYLKTYEKSTV